MPSLTADALAVRGFVAGTAALVINLGMLEPARQEASLIAATTARELGRPWLLDPVKVELSGGRMAFARRLLALQPAILRGNAGEIAALTAPGEPAAFARDTGSVVARTGAEDLVTDGAARLPSATAAS